MLTTNPEGHIDPTASVVENFLRWIPKHESQKRQLALNAALFSLPFTKDDLSAFGYTETERSDLYHWLIGQPFILHSPQDGRHIYHDVARDLFRRHLYRRSREDYYAARKALAHYYQHRLEVFQAKDHKSTYTSRSWKEIVWAFIQQVFLLPDEENHLLGIEYVLRVYEYEDITPDKELIRILKSLFSNEPEHQIIMHVQSLVEHLLQHIERDPEEHYQQWVVATNALLENVLHIPTFPSDVIAYLYRRKGRACRLVKDYQNALIHFNHALTLLPNYARIYTGRGLVYKFIERYEEAVTDFGRAIALDENNTWVFVQRGKTYRLMKRYEEAVTDFGRAIALDEKYAWAFTFRGQTYRLMGRNEEALADFDRAVALDENEDWNWYGKALIYLLIGQQDLFQSTLNVALNIVRSRIGRLTAQNDEYYRLRFNAALYLLVDGSLKAAEADYRQLLPMCSFVSRLQAAATDLEEFLTIQPANEFARNMLALVKQCIDEMKYHHSPR